MPKQKPNGIFFLGIPSLTRSLKQVFFFKSCGGCLNVTYTAAAGRAGKHFSRIILDVWTGFRNYLKGTVLQNNIFLLKTGPSYFAPHFCDAMQTSPSNILERYRLHPAKSWRHSFGDQNNNKNCLITLKNFFIFFLLHLFSLKILLRDGTFNIIQELSWRARKKRKFSRTVWWYLGWQM